MINYMVRRTLILMGMMLILSYGLFVGAIRLTYEFPEMSLFVRTLGEDCHQCIRPEEEWAERYALAQELGLYQPLHLRYAIWISGDGWIEVLPIWFIGSNIDGERFPNGDKTGIFRGDWGKTWVIAQGMPVRELISERLPNTLILLITTITVSLIFAIPLGILSAIRERKDIRTLLMPAIFGHGVSTFWVGLLSAAIFSYFFNRWRFPELSLQGQYAEMFFERSIHLILPVATLTTLMVGKWSRKVHTAMITILDEDYIRTAKAKGAGKLRVIIRHILPNILPDLVHTVLGSLPALIGGMILVETIFRYNGIGRLYIDALNRNDWPIVTGYFLILAIFVFLLNVIRDFAYLLNDPRVRYRHN